MGNWKIVRPEYSINYIINPSFEKNATDGWSNVFVSVARSSTRSTSGGYSCQITDGGASGHIRSDAIELKNGETLSGFADCWVAAGYSLFYMSIYDTTNSIERATSLVTARATWSNKDISWTNNTGGDVNVDIRFTANDGDGSSQHFIDKIQAEISTYSTTYIDGNQLGCRWIGSPHNSKSERLAFAYEGGRVLDFEDDYSAPVNIMTGVGVPPVQVSDTPLGLADGSLFDKIRIAARSFTLRLHVKGTTQSGYLDNRQSLTSALVSRAGKINQRPGPRRLRYTGATVDKYIDAVYTGGLEMVGDTDFSEETDVRFIAHDPLWYDLDYSQQVLDTNDSSADFHVVARKKDGKWDTMSTPNSTTASYTDVRTLSIGSQVGAGSLVYIGGTFTDFDDIPAADNIVSYDYDGNTYSALVTLNGTVYGSVFGPDGSLYVGGAFTNASGVADADYIAKWTGSAWEAVGVPNTGGAVIADVKALAFDSTGNLYVVGDFTNFADVAAADGIAKWDGSSWTAPGAPAAGSGLDCIAIDSQDNVYVGGPSTNIGSVAAADYLAKWDGSSWTSIGVVAGVGQRVRSLAIDRADNVFIGGTFSGIDGVTSANVIKYNGSGYEALGTGVDQAAYAMHIADDGRLWVGAQFSGGTQTSVDERLSIWNGSSWVYSGIDLPGTPTVYAITSVNDVIFIGYDTEGTGAFAGDDTITYTGTARAYPVIRLTRSGGTSATFQSIENVTTGARLYFDYDLLDGEELVIDTRPGHQSISSNFRGNVYSELLPGSDFGSFYLVPGVTGSQSNLIATFVDTAGGPTISAYMEWKNAYLGVD